MIFSEVENLSFSRGRTRVGRCALLRHDVRLFCGATLIFLCVFLYVLRNTILTEVLSDYGIHLTMIGVAMAPTDMHHRENP